MSRGQSFTVWANVYRSLNGAMGSVWASEELANQMAGRDRLACIPVLVPGDGLGVALREYILRGGHIAFPGGRE